MSPFKLGSRSVSPSRFSRCIGFLILALGLGQPLGIGLGATYHWMGGDGSWSPAQATWYDSMNFVGWSDGNRASFGGPQDYAGGGTILIEQDLMQVAGLNFADRSNWDSWYVIRSAEELSGGTPFVLNLTATDLNVEQMGYGEFQNVNLQRTGALNVKGSGGGTVVLGAGTKLHSTGFSSLIGGATVVVEAGAEWSSGDTFIVGTTVTNDGNGDGHLVINGGIVSSGLSTGSRNFILGNRSNTGGSLSVTLNSGELRVNANASTGLSFENIDYNTGGLLTPTDAVFNLNGGLLTTRRVVSSNNSGNPNASITGNTLFNFNGGTWKVVNPFGDSNITLVDRVKYVVRAGGAIIDTNGFNVLSRASFHSDDALVDQVDGGLTKLGAGKLTLAGDNYFTGDLQIREGGIVAFTDLRLGMARKIQIHDGASLENTTSSYTMKASRGMELGGDASWIVNWDTTVIYKGAIQNISGQTGRLLKKGTGTLDLRDGAQSSFTGGISILGGTLWTNSVRQLGSTSAGITIDGGSFIHDATEVITNHFVIGENGAKIGGNAWNGRGLFSGSGHLQVQGTVVFGGKNVNLDSHLEVLAWGNLGLRQASAMGTTSGGVTLRNNAILRLDHNGTGGSGFDAQDRFYRDALVMQSGAQLWSLGRNSVDNTAATAAVYQGAITLGGGDLVRMHVFNQNGTFASSEVPDLELTSSVSGAGGFYKTGAGRLVLSAQNSYTGKTEIRTGSVELRHQQALDSSGWIQVDAGASLQTSTLAQWKLQNVLSGEGTVHGNVLVEQLGQLRPGSNESTQSLASAGNLLGRLSIEGDLTLSSTAVNAVRLQLGESEADQLEILGQLTVHEGVKIEVVWAEGVEQLQVQSYDLLDWTGVAAWQSFDVVEQLILPSLHFLPGSSWDTSQFLSHGVLRVVPEPTRFTLLGVALIGGVMARRRF